MKRYLSFVALFFITACSTSTSQQTEQTEPNVPETATTNEQFKVESSKAVEPNANITADSNQTTPTDDPNLDSTIASLNSADNQVDQNDQAIEEAALQFARDISQDNAQVLSRVRAAFDNPDPDPDTVGFVVDENASDFEIAFRTAITALNDGNYVLAYENKFANELLASMATNEAIFPGGAEFNPQIEQYIEQLSYGLELGPDDFELDEPIFAEAVRALEESANANGVYFLELNLGSSDTRYIIPTNQNNYERWLNIAFQQELAVERLTWATIWDDIAYNIYDTDTYNIPGLLEYQKPSYRDARNLINR